MGVYLPPIPTVPTLNVVDYAPSLTPLDPPPPPPYLLSAKTCALPGNFECNATTQKKRNILVSA